MYKIKKSKSGILPVIIGLMATFFFACSEEERLIYIDKNAPAPATIDADSIKVENYAGGAILRYQLPNDDNLLSVKAVYETAPGVVREAKASRYADSLRLEGYARAGVYPVQLYSVGKNGKESAAVQVNVSPLSSPIYDAFETLDLNGMFGGVRGKFKNPDNALMSLVLSGDTTHTGNQTYLRTFVRAGREPSFEFLGKMREMETEFSVYLKDRWGNRTDARTFTCIPFLEDEFDKGLWRKYDLPSDNTVHYTTYRFETLWDGKNSDWLYFYVGASIIPLPTTWTIDLGQRVRLGRMVIYQAYNFPYNPSSAPKKIELWVSDSNRPGDDLEGGDWQLIARLESILPSGQEVATADDKSQGIYDGENMFIEPTEEIPNPYIPFRFLRIRTMKVYDLYRESANICLGEIDLFGSIQDK